MKHGRYLLMAWINRGHGTQTAAAAELGLKKAQLSKYLTGYARPTLDKALAIQRIAGVPVESWRAPKVSRRRNAPTRSANPPVVSGPEAQMAAG